MEYLCVEGFRKNFSSTEVLKGINFTLPKGEILAIIGASGSGKTTLLRCLNFLEPLDEGKVYLDGSLFADAKARCSEREIREKRLKFGLVFQDFRLFPHLTARGNILLAAQLRLRSRAAAEKRRLIAEAGRKGASARAREFLRAERSALEQRAEELLAAVGLTEKRDLYPSQLSGGQQQRIAIARALALDPAVLCFDEPTSALDPELTDEVLKVIRSLKGRTMIVVTHEMEFARKCADKVLFLADGAVEETGTPQEIFLSPKSEKLKAFLRREEL